MLCPQTSTALILQIMEELMKNIFSTRHWPSWLGLQNTPTASLRTGKTSPKNVLDMILNNLMVRLQ